MASQISSGKKAIPLAAFVAEIDRRRIETGVENLPRRAAGRRTASKLALLQAIKDAGGNW